MNGHILRIILTGPNKPLSSGRFSSLSSLQPVPAATPGRLCASAPGQALRERRRLALLLRLSSVHRADIPCDVARGAHTLLRFVLIGGLLSFGRSCTTQNRGVDSAFARKDPVPLCEDVTRIYPAASYPLQNACNGLSW